MRVRNACSQGSGLIVALGVLAMLAIMATTFITLVRLETRITGNYADELRCELLAQGAMQYFKALLRNDLDRTWGKYENRDSAVGAVGWQWSGGALGRAVVAHIPGVNTMKHGTAISNDFWFNPPYKAWTDWGNLFLGESNNPAQQQSFAGATGYSSGVIGRYYDKKRNLEVNTYVGRTLAHWHKNGPVVVHQDHPDAGAAIDFDGDGDAKPKDKGNSGAFYREENSVRDLYYDTAPFVLFSGQSYYFPGRRITGESSLLNGVFWRWGVKLGVAQSGYLNMNTAGNMDGDDSAYLRNIGGVGLRATQADDETENRDHVKGPPYYRYDKSIATSGGYVSLAGPELEARHLGRIHWLGFNGEYQLEEKGGFPKYYNEVYYHPAQVSLEKTFYRGTFNKAYRFGAPEGQWHQYSLQTQIVGAYRNDLKIPRDFARELIEYRAGPDKKAADGKDNYRVGWRRDGATYYKFLSPENPIDDDRYFGANEVMEHDHSVDHHDTSVIARTLGQDKSLEGEYWRQLRPYVTMWSTDTILRGKIWPTEGPPYTSAQGDWRHINILTRVNINMIGASGEEGLPDEDKALKREWLKKRDVERDRLYYMLVAGMNYTSTNDAEEKACQFIASLADTVDRDDEETYYAAPDTSGKWALGVERQPVLNEVVLSVRKANKPVWEFAYLRFELYNPMENIPWIRDGDEVLDISNYRLKINSHVWKLSELKLYPQDDLSPAGQDVSTIGADGLFGDPNDKTRKTWSRYLHVGWTSDFPAAISAAEAIGALTFELWKPLKGEAATRVPISGGKVEMVDGVKCVCVDRTDKLELLPSGVAVNTPFSNFAAYTGMYRRWDPLNARLYLDEKKRKTKTQGRDDNRNSLVHCYGWSPKMVATLGRPNYKYPEYVTKQYPGDSYRPQGKWNRRTRSAWQYRRHYERNFKVVDGDLPTIGWLGELVMKNAAQDGPVTWLHDNAQEPLNYRHGSGYYDGRDKDRGWANDLDYDGNKFDLYRPFTGVKGTKQHLPSSSKCVAKNLHMLDIFTVWDPSSDGLDNDGDGAIDDEDTGCQPADRGGPEVRVFGRLDLNLAPGRLVEMVFPDGYYARTLVERRISYGLNTGRSHMRGYNSWWDYWGPIETVGDLLRADGMSARPGLWMTGDNWSWVKGPHGMSESGYTRFALGRTWNDETSDPAHWHGDDDGDGIFDERDERDMLFTWVANHLSTRSNVFQIDLVIDICRPPRYPVRDDELRKLPMQAYKSARSVTHKQVLGILDRSTCLRVLPDGRCEFTGPIDVRMLRFSDDKRVH